MIQIGDRIGNIEIVDVLGRGGMGDVYAGFDEVLRRRVAVKVLRGRLRDDPQAQARFLREARLLSKLDHPNICRIHDFVQQAGARFLILEWIDGVPLSSALDRGLDAPAIESRHQLDIAIQLASVLVSAHGAGIVHRDLKPGNIMLTRGGEVKVLDFGLARLESRARPATPPGEAAAAGEAPPAVDPAVAASDATLTFVPSPKPGPQAGDLTEVLETREGQVMGTPLYMSPEQARGEAATVASDMFSFGLVLQALFTGRPPRAVAKTSVDRIQRGEVVPAAGVTGDRRALIERLVTPVPAARLTAVDALERLRWLREKPQRRRRRLALAAVVLAAALAGVKYTVDLDRERSAAVAARQMADQRREQAEQLIGFMLGDLRTKLEGVGRLEILDDVGRQAMDYFASVPEHELSDEELLGRSQALSQLADGWMAKGNLAAAEEACRAAMTLAEDLARRRPEESRYLARAGETRFWLGSVMLDQGNLPGAMAEFETYLRSSRRLVALEPERSDWQMELAYGHVNVGAVDRMSGDLDSAVEHFERALAVLRQLTASQPERDDWQQELANTLSWLGSTHRDRGDLAAARTAYEQALAVHGALASRSAEDTGRRYRLANIHSHLGRLAWSQGQVQTALEHLRSFRRLAAELVEHDARNLRWGRNLAVAQRQLGGVLVAAAQAAQGRREIERALRFWYRQVERDPSNVDWQRESALTHVELAKAQLVMGQTSGALASARRASGILEPLLDAAADQPELARDLGQAYVAEGRSLEARGQLEAARRAWRKAAALRQRTAAELTPRAMVAQLEALLHLGQVDEARGAVRALIAGGYREPGFIALCQERGIAVEPAA